MHPQAKAKLDDFEKLLIDTVLQRGQSKITQQQWMRMYTISTSMTSFDEQEQFATYIVEKLYDFMNMWSKRLDDVQSNTISIAEEFSLFWESIQLYLFAKKNLFQDFFNLYNQERIIRMALLHLNKGFFSKHIPRVTKTLIYFLNEDRNGNVIPAPQIKRVIRMIYEIGLGDDIDLKRGQNNDFFYHPFGHEVRDFFKPEYLAYYREHFENVMIEDLNNIYAVKSQEWLQQTTPEYCRIGLTYYLQELKRAEEFYNLSYEKVRDVLIDIIITQRYEYLCTNPSSGILQQLSKKAITDLKAVYSLFKQSVINKQEFYPPIKRISSLLGDYISEQIKLILTKPREGSQSVVAITQEILEMSSYVENVLKEAFDNDRDIGKESDHFLQQSLNVEKRCPLIFADYAHFLLTKDLAQSNSDQDLDAKIDAFFKVINKIYDKDIFLSKLRDLLALRLLEKASIDTEKKFLGKMGTDWGLGDQSKMKNMLDDIATSDELLKDWKSSSNNPKNIDFSIKVLRTSCWPDRLFVKDKQQKVFADPVVQDYKKKFTMYYQNKNQGKNLEWVVNYGTAEIKTSGFQKSYFLQTTSIQMAVLLLFNYADTWTYGDIKDKLGLTEGSSHLWEALRFFTSKLKLINREQTGGGEGADKKPAEDNEKFSVNMAFKSDRLKINCVPSLAIKSAGEKKPAEDLAEVMKEREFVIDAAIVRIMKSRREMALLDLQQETKKLISLFIPDPKMVKRRIDSLMERDYLERHPDKNNVFIYKP